MEKRTFILAHEVARANAIEAVRNAPQGYAVVIQERTRTLDQNAAQWPILQALPGHLLAPACLHRLCTGHMP